MRHAELAALRTAGDGAVVDDVAVQVPEFLVDIQVPENIIFLKFGRYPFPSE